MPKKLYNRQNVIYSDGDSDWMFAAQTVEMAKRLVDLWNKEGNYVG